MQLAKIQSQSRSSCRLDLHEVNVESWDVRGLLLEQSRLEVAAEAYCQAH